MNKKTWHNLALGASALTLLTVSACGSGDGGSQDRNPKQGASPAISVIPGSAGSPPAVSSSAGRFTVHTDDKLGPVVSDARGMTVYVFDKDTTPGTSACEGACAKDWPAVPADRATASPGLNQDLLGSLTRPDGTRQLTLAGKPLYYYAKDTKPKETSGQNIGGVWHAAAPDGWKSGVPRPALGVLNDPKLGPILQDGNGRTLYLFTKDTPWPMKTACGTACLATWTPTGLVSEADAKAAGLPAKTLFPFTTANGSRQESFNCWPGYTFKGDTQPGLTGGQNVGGVWFAIKANIKKIDRGATVPAAKG
ncbi:lipoprotein [Streptomyces sulfonofaciens]|uniref:Lipoprotein n=1 Tax=Streptomyces sulfonofaciens TaxID=68272 RepID=A0A919GQN3_9ACTN|nr:SCO0930 family lipoprotein [Streptomyces sulfonofaciens]GHH88952.1 lipoprotein [Streptomyces sulfonofaciens]